MSADLSLDLRRAIDALPRIKLAVLPTPLDEAPRLSAKLGGPRILVKRDDLTGLAMGGNKVRMFEFVLARARQLGADVVVGGSAVQSNYSRQLAAACAHLGLDCHLVLRRVRGREDDEVQGNLLLDLILGARVQIVDGWAEHAQALRDLVETLQRRGHRVYKARNASDEDNALHAVAYSEAALELEAQLSSRGAKATHHYISSLDTTHAGLLIGFRALGSTSLLRAVSPFEASVWPDRTIEEEVVRIANSTADLLKLEVRMAVPNIHVTTKFAGERYGLRTPEGVEAAKIFASTEGLLLDPVYTGKAAAALISDIRTGVLTRHDTVVFWHTGGQPAIFAYGNDFAFEFPPRYGQGETPLTDPRPAA